MVQKHIQIRNILNKLDDSPLKDIAYQNQYIEKAWVCIAQNLKNYLKQDINNYTFYDFVKNLIQNNWQCVFTYEKREMPLNMTNINILNTEVGTLKARHVFNTAYSVKLIAEQNFVCMDSLINSKDSVGIKLIEFNYNKKVYTLDFRSDALLQIEDINLLADVVKCLEEIVSHYDTITQNILSERFEKIYSAELNIRTLLKPLVDDGWRLSFDFFDSNNELKIILSKDGELYNWREKRIEYILNVDSYIDDCRFLIIEIEKFEKAYTLLMELKEDTSLSFSADIF